MNREQKAAVIEEIAADIKGSNAVIAVDYRGISVGQAAELRGKLREADASFRVVKNSLSQRAADQVGAEELKVLLAGPTALTFVRGDVALAAKAIADQARATQLLPFKGGVMDGAPLTPEQMGQISRLPARDVLYGQLVGLVASPISGLVRTLNALIAGVAIQLGGVLEKKQSGEIPAGEPPPSASPDSASAPSTDAPAGEAPSASPDSDSAPSADAPAGEAPSASPDSDSAPSADAPAPSGSAAEGSSPDAGDHAAEAETAPGGASSDAGDHAAEAETAPAGASSDGREQPDAADTAAETAAEAPPEVEAGAAAASGAPVAAPVADSELPPEEALAQDAAPAADESKKADPEPGAPAENDNQTDASADPVEAKEDQ